MGARATRLAAEAAGDASRFNSAPRIFLEPSQRMAAAARPGAVPARFTELALNQPASKDPTASWWTMAATQEQTQRLVPFRPSPLISQSRAAPRWCGRAVLLRFAICSLLR